MLKVVLADDEKYVLVVIKSILKELDLPIEIVGEANDGEEAYELCMKLHPDILITDICMPRENGLDLIKKVRITLPSIQIIILSGYNDFSYAKQAIHYGVSEYLLKPAEEEEVYKAIDKISKVLAQKGKKDLEEGIYNAFNEIIHTTKDQLKKEKDYYEIYLRELRADCVGVIILYDQQMSCKEWKKQCRAILEQKVGGYICENKKDNHELICFYSKAAIKNSIKEEAEAIQNALKEQGYEGILLSYACKRFEEIKVLTIKNTYMNAKEALEAYFWYEEDRVFTDQNKLLKEELPNIKMNEHVAGMYLLSIKLLKKENTLQILENYLEQLGHDYKYYKPLEVKQLMWRLLEKAMEVTKLPGEDQLGFHDSRNEFFLVLSYNKAKNMIISLTIKLMDRYEKINGSDQQHNFEEAMKEYVHQNYNKELDLERLAAYLNFNPSYLSSLFKKKTGYNFSKYVTQIRIENAKRLLESNEFKVLEIAEQVGYMDTKYFAKMFKHVTGMTPSDYQKEYFKQKVSD